MAQNNIIPITITGGIIEAYTPANGRITSVAANNKGQGSPVKIQGAMFILSTAANVTFVDYSGNLTTAFPCAQGLFPYVVREIRAVSAGTVLIVHDGQLCVDEA